MQAFSGILFEPLMVTAVAGMILLCFSQWKKRNAFFWVVAGGVFFLILWRLYLGSSSSSRYTAILLFPAIIFTVYLLYFNIFERSFSRFLLLILAIICLGKDFHFNPYDDCIPRIGECIRADSLQHAGAAILLGDAKDARRIEYYAEIGAVALPEATLEQCRDFILEQSNAYRHVYVVVNENSDRSPTLAEELGIPPEQWQFVGSFFRNRSQRKKLSVYRYSPEMPGGEFTVLNGKFFNGSAGQCNSTLPLNGNFEKENPMPQSSLPTADQWGAGLEFFLQPNLKFPEHWSIRSTFGFAPDCKAEIELSSDAISGHYSLRMASRNLISIYTKDFIPAGDYRLHLLIRGLPGSYPEIFLTFYDSKKRFLSYRNLCSLPLRTFGIIKCTIPISVPTGQQFRIVLALHQGEVFWDGIALQPAATLPGQLSLSGGITGDDRELSK
ncbi:hypothetical protein [Victivallis sp. Marseille-Q1083]|uniref:hypothetical protein n=1 Tax=Victivallis sp. Marseille-Q1083 TaxID=2717288 RepID=UPI00158EA583|nr:hypothetical protein [Victivallis sp. Marseille-Q1083]